MDSCSSDAASAIFVRIVMHRVDSACATERLQESWPDTSACLCKPCSCEPSVSGNSQMTARGRLGAATWQMPPCLCLCHDGLHSWVWQARDCRRGDSDCSRYWSMPLCACYLQCGIATITDERRFRIVHAFFTWIGPASRRQSVPLWPL